MRISTSFLTDGWVPARYTCDGRDVSPRLDILDVPEGCASLALVVDDPDAPHGVFTHWLVWNVPPAVTTWPDGAAPAGAYQGTNDFGVVGWSGPCPPNGPPHRYRFRLFALDRTLELGPGARADALAAELGHGVLASAEMAARYARTRS